MKLTKLASVLLLSTMLSMPLFAQHRSSGSRPYYGGGHHTTSHGGHYPGSVNAHHRGGHYTNPRTGNRYGKHQP